MTDIKYNMKKLFNTTEEESTALPGHNDARKKDTVGEVLGLYLLLSARSVAI